MGASSSKLMDSEEFKTFYKACLKSATDKLRFPGFQDQSDEKFLKHKQETETMFSNMADISIKLASLFGLHDAIVFILEIAKSQIYYSSLEDDILKMKMKKEIVEMVHFIDKTEIKSIIYQLDLLNDPDLPTETRKMHLAIADNTCHALLQKFSDEKFYLKQYPLAFSPFLMTFVAVYMPIAKANYKITETKHRKVEYLRNMKTLMDIVIYFKEQGVKERLKYIENNYCFADHFFKNLCFEFRYLHSEAAAEVYYWYRERVKILYEAYYEPALKVVKETIKETQ